MNRVCWHPYDTHVSHKPVSQTKRWNTRCTATLLLSSYEPAGKVCDVLVCWLILGGVRVEAGVHRHAVHGEELRVRQILAAMLVKGVPVHIRSSERRRVDRGWAELLLKVTVILDDILSSGILGKHPQGSQLIVEQAVRDHFRSRLGRISNIRLVIPVLGTVLLG